MSVLRFMKPCLILIHGDSVPYGKYWDYFVSISPNIILVNRTLLTHIFGNTLAFKEHGADVMRIEALKGNCNIVLTSIFSQILNFPFAFLLALLAKGQTSLCHSLLSVVRPSTRLLAILLFTL